MKLSRLVILGLIFLGLLDAAFLTYEHYFVGIPPCHVGFSLIDCGQVLRSQYSVFLGIPLAVWGLGYYFSLLVIYLYLPKFSRAIIIVGLAVSAVLFYLQIGVIKSVCLYCLFSEMVILSLFVFTMPPVSSILDAWRKGN